MLKKIIVILLIAISLVFIFFILQILLYLNYQKENTKLVEFCKVDLNTCYIDNENNPVSKTIYYRANAPWHFFYGAADSDSCYCRMYNLLLPRLLVYKVKSDNKDLKFVRYSKRVYIIPTLILEKADAFINYGIDGNAEFENNIANLYKKNTYAYDCGIRNVDIREPNLFFKSECIGTDDYILPEHGQTSSKKIHTFGEKLKELNLEDKKVFLKMSIAGAEIEVLPDILKYSKNITGIAVVPRVQESETIIKMNEILKLIEKDFILVSRNFVVDDCRYGCGCKYMGNEISQSLSLVYINKNLVDKKYLPVKQDYHDSQNYEQDYKLNRVIPPYNISPIVVISEKVKQIFNIKDN